MATETDPAVDGVVAAGHPLTAEAGAEILRAGGNDIHAGRIPAEVAADFAEFVRVVHARLPRTEILYVAVSPAPARWGESGLVK